MSATRNNINIRHLQYFISVVECGSMLKASEKLRVSQPTISSGIRKLEETVGVEIFERSRSGVRLTTYGKTLHEYASRIVFEMNEAIINVQRDFTQAQGQIVIGALPIATEMLLTAAVAGFKRRNPTVSITIEPGVSASLLPKLKNGELDLIAGFGATLRYEPLVEYRPLFNERLSLIVNKKHPLANAKCVNASDLTEFEWFVPYPYTEYRRHVIDIFAKTTTEYPRNVFSAPYHLSKEYIRRSSAIGLLPSEYVATELVQGNLSRIEPTFALPMTEVGFCHRAGQPLNPTLRDLVTEIRRAATALVRDNLADPAFI